MYLRTEQHYNSSGLAWSLSSNFKFSVILTAKKGVFFLALRTDSIVAYRCLVVFLGLILQIDELFFLNK